MSQLNKHFLISLLLATLLHATLFFGLQGVFLRPPKLKPLPPHQIVYLVAPSSSHQKSAPKQVNALSDNNRQLSNTLKSKAESPADFSPFKALIVTQWNPENPLAVTSLPTPPRAAPRPNIKIKPVTTLKRLPIPVVNPKARIMVKKEKTTPKPLTPKTQSKPSSSVNPVTQTTNSQNTLQLVPSMNNLTNWDQKRGYQAMSGLKREETISINTRKVRYAAYFSQLKRRVEQGWVYPSKAKRHKLFGSVNLLFSIQRDGRLLAVKVVRSSGEKILDESATLAVNRAAPFSEFPDDWSLERLHIRATFEYIPRGVKWR